MPNENSNIFVNRVLKTQLERKSQELGYDVNEVIDLIINGFIKGEYHIDFDAKTVIPRVDQETQEAIAQSIKDFEAGNYIEINTKDPNFMKKLLE